MNIGVVGLGLIGGSLVKAIRQKTGHGVLGFDKSDAVMEDALKTGVLDGRLDAMTTEKCDTIIVCLYPDAVIDWMEKNRALIPKGAVVTDTCGVKGVLCAEGEALARENGFAFVGGHPMAGKEKTGWRASDPSLFEGASMILTPIGGEENQLTGVLSGLYRDLGFGRVVVTTPEHHDRMIAFTSQLPHVLSSAYVRSSASVGHHGFSAGSYRDLSRVATLNENLWTDLFLANRAALQTELDEMVRRLNEYADALRASDGDVLRSLLRAGRIAKEELDGKVLAE